MKGDSYTGKDFIVRSTFKELDIVPVEFSISKLAKNLTHRISSQDLIHYLDKLKERTIKPFSDKRYIYIHRIDKIVILLTLHFVMDSAT